MYGYVYRKGIIKLTTHVYVVVRSIHNTISLKRQVAYTM
jgi:hypothetical protein